MGTVVELLGKNQAQKFYIMKDCDVLVVPLKINMRAFLVLFMKPDERNSCNYLKLTA